MGTLGNSIIINKIINECEYVNGLEISGAYSINKDVKVNKLFNTIDELLDESDSVYICSRPALHYEQIKMALEKGKHVLCETPIALTRKEKNELHKVAKKNKCILMDSIKTLKGKELDKMKSFITQNNYQI